MAFHEHNTLRLKRIKEGIELVCITCGKSWQKGFAIISHSDGRGNILDKTLVNTETGETIPCDLLKTKKMQKENSIEISHTE